MGAGQAYHERSGPVRDSSAEACLLRLVYLKEDSRETTWSTTERVAVRTDTDGQGWLPTGEPGYLPTA